MTFMVPIGTVEVMSEHQNILHELADLERRTGVAPATVCRRATNNPRMYDRLKRRLEKMDEHITAIRAEMAAIEAASSAEGPSAA